MITPQQLAAYPETARLFRRAARSPLWRAARDRVLAGEGPAYLRFCEDTLGLLRRRAGEAGLRSAASAFLRYSAEHLLLQRRLEREGRYLHSAFAEADAAVYHGPAMAEYYLDGLLLSQLLWPNHYRLMEYFLSCRRLTGPGTRALDAACGPGLHSYLLARRFAFGSLKAVDISPHAAAYAESLLAGLPPARRRKTAVEPGDVFELPENVKFGFIVCGELLEHVERPSALVAKLARLLRPGGAVFLTAAVYAAAVDHIRLFRSPAEVRTLLRRRFRIESELVLPVRPGDPPEGPCAPVNYGCVLRAR